jgi:hypothetical protein
VTRTAFPKSGPVIAMNRNSMKSGCFRGASHDV